MGGTPEVGVLGGWHPGGGGPGWVAPRSTSHLDRTAPRSQRGGWHPGVTAGIADRGHREADRGGWHLDRRSRRALRSPTTSPTTPLLEGNLGRLPTSSENDSSHRGRFPTPSEGDLSRWRRPPTPSEGDLSCWRRPPTPSEGDLSRWRRPPTPSEDDPSCSRRPPTPSEADPSCWRRPPTPSESDLQPCFPDPKTAIAGSSRLRRLLQMWSKSQQLYVLKH